MCFPSPIWPGSNRGFGFSGALPGVMASADANDSPISTIEIAALISSSPLPTCSFARRLIRLSWDLEYGERDASSPKVVVSTVLVYTHLWLYFAKICHASGVAFLSFSSFQGLVAQPSAPLMLPLGAWSESDKVTAGSPILTALRDVIAEAILVECSKGVSLSPESVSTSTCCLRRRTAFECNAERGLVALG